MIIFFFTNVSKSKWWDSLILYLRFTAFLIMMLSYKDINQEKESHPTSYQQFKIECISVLSFM